MNTNNDKYGSHADVMRDNEEKQTNVEKVILAVTEIVLEAIQEAGTKGIPNGHLYTMLISYVSFNTYTAIIDALVKTGKVKQTNFILTAVTTTV